MNDRTTWWQLVFVIVTLPFFMLLSSLMVIAMWGWFVAEPFGVARLNIPHAMGLHVLALWWLMPILGRLPKDRDPYELSPFQKYLLTPIVQVLVFGWAWIVHAFQ